MEDHPAMPDFFEKLNDLDRVSGVGFFCLYENLKKIATDRRYSQVRLLYERTDSEWLYLYSMRISA